MRVFGAAFVFGWMLIVATTAAGSDLAVVLKTMQDSLLPLRSISIEADVRPVPNSDIKEDNEKLHTSHILYVAREHQFLIDYVQTNAKGEVDWSQRFAYDGTKSRNFYRHDDTLFMDRGRVGPGAVSSDNFFFEPFAFFLGDRTTGADPILTIPDFRPPTLFSKALSTWKEVGTTTVAGQQCLVYDAPGGRTKFEKFPYSFRFRVYLSVNQRMYPIRWERLTSNNVVRRSYDVLRVDTVDGVSIPLASLTRVYENDGSLVATIRHDVVRVRVNEPIEESVFTIDPAAAGTVFDGGRTIKAK